MANMDLVDEVMTFLKSNPEKHQQGVWLEHIDEIGDGHEPIAPETNFCGTTGCIAGWAVAFAKVHDPDVEIIWTDGGGSYVHLPGHTRCSGVGLAAQEILGLTNDQASYIFDGGRDMEEIEAAFDEIRLYPDWLPSDDLCVDEYGVDDLD